MLTDIRIKYVIPAQAEIQGYFTTAILIITALLVGCDAPGTARLKELCETEGYPKVYEKVYAAGYYDDRDECGGAVLFLPDRDYQFIECRQSRKMPLGPDKPGLYRISKVDPDSGLCDEELMKKFAKYPLRLKTLTNSGICLSVKEIDTPTAKFGLFNGKRTSTSLDNIFESKIISTSKYIKNLDTGALVAEATTFGLYPTPGFSVSSFERVLHCRTVVPELRKVNGLATVDEYIIPTTPGKEKDNGNNRRDIPGGTAR